MATTGTTAGVWNPPTPAAIAAEKASIELTARVAEIIGRLNLAYAELVEVIAQADAVEAWAGVGIRDLEHWITWQAGLSASTAKQIHRVANALETHPQITERFREGMLTLDQAAAAVTVLPDHDGEIAGLATAATVAQIRTMARASRPPRSPKRDDPPAQHEQLTFGKDDDGWLRGQFIFGPDRAQIFNNALQEARDRMFAGGAGNLAWSDVLIEILEQSLAAQPPDRARRYDVHLFIDPTKPIEGRWADGITVNPGLQQLFTCDGWIRPTILDGAVPVGVGRAQRTIPERLRRLVFHRDRGVCQTPWCNRTRGLDVHHIVHWEHRGPTETWNLLLLCRRCHRDLHLGQFDIVGNADRPATLQFLNPSGFRIDRPLPKLDPAPNWKRPETPYQHPTGERADWRYFDLPPPKAS